MSSFAEIKKQFKEVDARDLEDWENQHGWAGRRASLEDHLSFVEWRRQRLAGTINEILDALIAKEPS